MIEINFKFDFSLAKAFLFFVYSINKKALIKISDFGLSRDIYLNDNYRQKESTNVPIRWMAPECCKDRLYSASSDVVRFV